MEAGRGGGGQQDLNPLPGLAPVVTGTRLAGTQVRSPGWRGDAGVKILGRSARTHLVPRRLDVQPPLGEGGLHADEERALLDPGGGGHLGGAGLWGGGRRKGMAS